MRFPNLEVFKLHEFLVKNSMVFRLEQGECGESDVVTMSTSTGTGKSAARNAERWSDTALKSPWSNPVVMVKKKDGSHQFCVNYWGLNSMTKEEFPLHALMTFRPTWRG